MGRGLLSFAQLDSPFDFAQGRLCGCPHVGFLRGRLCAPNSLIRICGQGGHLLPVCGMGVQINGSGRLSAAIAILAVKI